MRLNTTLGTLLSAFAVAAQRAGGHASLMQTPVAKPSFSQNTGFDDLSSLYADVNKLNQNQFGDDLYGLAQNEDGTSTKYEPEADTEQEVTDSDVISPGEIADAAKEILGAPATRKRSQFASREDLGLEKSDRFHVDIGGEGFHEASGVVSGFKGAVNLNAQKFDSQYPDKEIPNLVQLEAWHTDPPFPFKKKTVDRYTMQGAPLTRHNVNEITRTLAENGTVELWLDHGEFDKELKELASNLDAKIEWSDDPNTSVVDEFDGGFPTPKVVLKRGSASE
ncbi:hypothetical protein JM93_01561 [Roseibium hamelinense]|uniref:Uncharacterized protein n=1 Tax=Roseibium hamelinense TaxID=150831 RepID=A0A562T855_9HYPH|nr:hypothetical protein [Roseibium hamelinense]MTI43680.1 hypothetical protein [Roseibium hamelinense]TWI89358.1 hypothetical protein JM93_01561 [Roseibium hamelinense]